MGKVEIGNFILMIDTSGSMYGLGGEKIICARNAAEDFLCYLSSLSIEPEPCVAIIAYGAASEICVPFTKVSAVFVPELTPYGTSQLKKALELAEEIINNETALVIITDGRIDGNGYKKLLSKIPLITRAYAVKIGFDADMRILEDLTDGLGFVMSAYETASIADNIYCEQK